MGSKLADIVKELKEKYPQIEVSQEMVITVPVSDLLPFMQELKDNYAFDFLTNLTAVDYPGKKKGKDGEEAEDDGVMEVIYNLNSIAEGYSLMVKTKISRQNSELPSVFPIWGGANWQEREVYDLFGIVFTGHPNLKRILLDEHFEGHPLRKDYEWVGGRQ